MFSRMMYRMSMGALALLFLAGTGYSETFQIDPVHSSVGFSVRHIFSRVPGTFTNFSGSVVYDSDHPENSSVNAIIQAASVNTENGRRDNHLRSPDFFDVEKFPEITFTSTSVKMEEDRLMVTGDLTMHGVTKSVEMPVEVLGVGPHPVSKAPVAGFAADLEIKRSDFGVNSWTDPAGVVGDEVRIVLNIEAAGKAMWNPCNPCNPCGGNNPCNPCGGNNPCNPCGGNNPCNPCGN